MKISDTTPKSNHLPRHKNEIPWEQMLKRKEKKKKFESCEELGPCRAEDKAGKVKKLGMSRPEANHRKKYKRGGGGGGSAS